MRSLVPLLLVFVSAAASHRPSRSGGRLSKAGSSARIVFDPAASRFPETNSTGACLPLRPDSPWIKDVRSRDQSLYNTGRYSDISVEAEPEDAGVSLRSPPSFSYFVSRVTIDGAAEPPNREQLVAATKLELGGPFDDGQMVQAVKNMLERLRANGLYKSKVTYRVDRNPGTEEAGYLFRNPCRQPRALRRSQSVRRPSTGRRKA